MNYSTVYIVSVLMAPKWQRSPRLLHARRKVAFSFCAQARGLAPVALFMTWLTGGLGREPTDRQISALAYPDSPTGDQPSPSFPSHSLCPLPFLSPLLPLPLEVSPLKYSYRGSGERCKLPIGGMGRSTSGNRIWCILALKSDIWWHQFY